MLFIFQTTNKGTLNHRVILLILIGLEWRVKTWNKKQVNALINNRLLYFYINLSYNEGEHKPDVLMPLGVMNKGGTAFNGDGIAICDCMKIIVHFTI